MSDWYFDLVSRKAAEWGLVADPELEAEAYGVKLPIVETLRHRARAKAYLQSRLEVVRLGDRWSYCWSVNGHDWGNHYGPFVTFCRPYGSRAEALTAASRELLARIRAHNRSRRNGMHDDDRRLRRWAERLAPNTCAEIVEEPRDAVPAVQGELW